MDKRELLRIADKKLLNVVLSAGGNINIFTPQGTIRLDQKLRSTQSAFVPPCQREGESMAAPSAEGYLLADGGKVFRQDRDGTLIGDFPFPAGQVRVLPGLRGPVVLCLSPQAPCTPTSGKSKLISPVSLLCPKSAIASLDLSRSGSAIASLDLDRNGHASAGSKKEKEREKEKEKEREKEKEKEREREKSKTEIKPPALATLEVESEEEEENSDSDSDSDSDNADEDSDSDSDNGAPGEVFYDTLAQALDFDLRPLFSVKIPKTTILCGDFSSSGDFVGAENSQIYFFRNKDASPYFKVEAGFHVRTLLITPRDEIVAVGGNNILYLGSDGRKKEEVKTRTPIVGAALDLDGDLLLLEKESQGEIYHLFNMFPRHRKYGTGK